MDTQTPAQSPPDSVHVLFSSWKLGTYVLFISLAVSQTIHAVWQVVSLWAAENLHVPPDKIFIWASPCPQSKTKTISKQITWLYVTLKRVIIFH